jgi:methyl-accepting chemotaxis protein
MQFSFWQLSSDQVKDSSRGEVMTMENKRSRFRRLNYLIDKRSQTYLAVLLVFYLVVYSLALLAVILAPSALVFTSDSVPLEQKLETSREFLLLNQRVVPAVSLIVLLLAAHFIFITHRVFGPLFRFRRVLCQWAEGEWPRPFKARPRDFHQEVFDDFNKATATLKGDFGEVKAKISAALAEVQKMESSTVQLEQTCQLKNIGQSCQAARAILNKYGL